MSDTSWDSYLQPGETLLWQGAPVRGIRNKLMVFGIAIVGVPFLAIGLGAMANAIGSLSKAQTLMGAGEALVQFCFGVPFAAVGAAAIFGLAYVSGTAHRHIRYALSTHSAFISATYWKPTLTIFPIAKGQFLELQKGAGADTIWFHKHEWRDSDGDNRKSQLGFENIADGEMVFQLFLQIAMRTNGKQT